LSIVFTSNTVVKVFAMMIEALNTSLASLAVITALMNLDLAIKAINFLIFLIIFGNFKNKVIHRILTSDIDIVINNGNKKTIGGSYNNP